MLEITRKMKLKNEYINLEITKNGGSLTSIFDKENNKELLYQPIKDSWQGQDIFIYPFIARLKDGYYLDNGNRYEFKNHGLIRYMEGEEVDNGDSLSVIFRSDEETLSRYPYEFKAVINYKIIKKHIEISYEIQNLSGKTMCFMLGAHPAFRVSGVDKEDHFDMSGTYVEFDNDSPISLIPQEETASFCLDEQPNFITGNKLELDKEVFKKVNTIILKADNFSKVVLHRNDGSILTVNKGNASYIALWSDGPKGDFVCIEPWFGIPDEVDVKRELKDKKGVEKLEPNGAFKFKYTIEI